MKSTTIDVPQLVLLLTTIIIIIINDGLTTIKWINHYYNHY